MARDRFDNDKLREEALKAFVKALHTDRMVAVTGAMSTRALGYPSWDEFVQAYALVAIKLAKEIHKKREDVLGGEVVPGRELLEAIVGRAETLEANSRSKELDPRVAMWTIHDSFRALDRQMRQVRMGLVIDHEYQQPALEQFERRIAGIFASRTLDSHPEEAAIHPLIGSLGIRRIATLNYDLELERAFMLRDDERRILGKEVRKASERLAASGPFSTPAARFAAKVALTAKAPAERSELGSVEHFIGERATGKPIIKVHRNRLTRTMGTGIQVDSDIVDRERPDRVFQFAIGAADGSQHILHLHGRADVPSSMVANIRQYDRLYRLDDLYRDPFDHGLRVLLGGNPILFVGLGMNEDELNQFLQYFVSNVPVRRPAPMFIVWNTNTREGADKRDYMRQRRLDFHTRLGVHFLFDEDIVQPGDDWLKALRVPHAAATVAPDPAGYLDLVKPQPAAVPAPPSDRLRSTHLELKALATMVAKLPDLVTRVDRRIEREDVWRTIDPRLAIKHDEPYRLYGSTALQEFARKSLQQATEGRSRFHRLRAERASEPDNGLVLVSAPPGYGRGLLAECLAQTDETGIVLGNAPLFPTERDNRLIVNAGFSYDSDTMLVGIASFLHKRVAEFPEGRSSRERLFADGTYFNTIKRSLILINGADRFFSFDGIPLSAELDHMLRCALKARGNVQIVLLGTERLRRYGEAIGVPLQKLAFESRIKAAELKWAADSKLKSAMDEQDWPLKSTYLEWVAANFAGRAPLRRKVVVNNARRRGITDESRLKAEADRVDITDAAFARIARAIRIDRDALPRAFFEAYLSPSVLNALGVDCPAAFEILRTMCFIAGPIEAAALLYAPKVRAILAEDSKTPESPGTDKVAKASLRRKLAETMAALRRLGLIVQLDPHDPPGLYSDRGPPESRTIFAIGPETARSGYRIALEEQTLWGRFSLHRSLATFLRDRHGAPINDAKLATTFNMSLFMSEPSDNYTPDPDFHDELGDLVDSLIGGWHDIEELYGEDGYGLGEEKRDRYRKALEDLYIHPADEDRAWSKLNPRSSRVAAACLRCALSLVRNYYSTGALLKFDRSDRIASADRDGALTEHAQRLDRLITAFGDISIARKIVRTIFSDAAEKAIETQRNARGVSKLPDEEEERIRDDWKKERLRHMGPDPFYQDDLVWLHNERGVVALTQGHLYDARESFSAAFEVNDRHVECNYHGHNWRRISINRVATRIERGMLKPAERLLDQIEDTVNSAPWCEAQLQRKNRVEAIRKLFRRPGDPPMHGDTHHTREEMLIVGMVTGYRGLIAHMRGRYHEAKDYYESSIQILRRLGEQRAYAHFQRHFASLQSFIGDKAGARIEIEHAINSAQSAKQMDILHRSRVVRANILRAGSTDAVKRREALQDIKEALNYSALSDCYRVRIEASTSLARHMRESGDYDTALRYATDALTIAGRYGHSLQKNSLMIEIGHILKARGDPMSGEAMLDLAIVAATSKGYHLALERIRRARSTDGGPLPPPNRTDIPVSG